MGIIDLPENIDWVAIVLQIVHLIEESVGMNLPRFDGDGKLLMPESNSSREALELLDKSAVADALLQAACAADPSLHAAISVAALNAKDQDHTRLMGALKKGQFDGKA